MQRSICKIILVIACLSALIACEREPSNSEFESTSNEPFALYINVGGDDYRDQFGHMYWGDRYSNGGNFGEIAHVKGAQDDFIYRSYREGDFSTATPIEKGLYDVTLLWAEPAPTEVPRRFDVVIEGRAAISNMNVIEQRFNKSVTAMNRTIPKVKVEDGFLNIALHSISAKAFLNGVVIRKRADKPEQEWGLLWSDEFNTDGHVNPSLWHISDAADDDEHRVKVEYGQLVLTAEHKAHSNIKTVAQIYSKIRQLNQFGRIEIGARLPRAKDLRSVVWLLPDYLMQDYLDCVELKDAKDCTLSQNVGEVDILERVSSEQNSVHAAVHFKNHYWNNEQQSTAGIKLDSVATKVHEYAIEWTPDRLDIYADDVLYFSHFKEHTSQQIPWLFDHNYYVVISQIATNKINDDETSPMHHLSIDYIRAYERVGY